MAVTAPSITFIPSIQELLQSRSKNGLTILSGPNNSGKSYLLKQLCRTFKTGAHFFGCNRFFHIRELQTTSPDEQYLQNMWRSYENQFAPNAPNTENNSHNLEEVLRGLNDRQRDTLFGLFKELIGSTISLQHTIRDNVMTPFYVDVDGESLAYGSTGTRLLLTLLGTCFDERFDRLFIDEPELGLSPKIQSIIGLFFSDLDKRAKYMPHLKSVYIATHSHLFLDRSDIRNNFIVEKQDKSIHATNVSSVSQFHQLQFNLLGNDLESIFMPSAIVIVEGKTDQMFLRHVFSLKLSDRKITVVLGGSDGETEKKLHTLREAFGDLRRSPYHDRTFVLLDARNSVKRNRIIEMGIDEKNVWTWSKNGIEFYYPREIMTSIFVCGDSQIAEMDCDDDVIMINGVRRTKTHLAVEVCARVVQESCLNEELLALLTRLDLVTR